MCPVIHTGLRPSTQRINQFQNVTLNPDLLALLDSTLRDMNPFAQAYKMLKEFEEGTMREEDPETATEIRMYIKSDRVSPVEHRGRYNTQQRK